MRNLKRFLAMTLTMLMVVGCFVLTSSAKFEDVTDFQSEITILSDLGVIKGKADGTFGFDEAVTRRQEALFIARASTGKVNDTVWTSTVNNSQFTDLDATNDYYGAISYCANLGIIKGRTSTAFYPNDNIIFQEAVAMVVRALGYGSATMDAGYPYTYYDKAVSLGLDKGIEDVALTDVVSRGVAAKLLYNALFATNSDGTTMAADAFGAVVKSTTVVIVSTAGKNLVGYNQPSAAGTVSFCEINADGTFNVSKVYNLNWSAFVNAAFAGDTSKKALDYVGASFDVVTINGFSTLSTATCNPFTSFDQDKAAGAVIDGHTYTLVNKWSTVFNTGTTWSGVDELQKFNTAFVDSNVAGIDVIWYAGYWYLVDNNKNILESSTHQILLYYRGADTAWVNAYGTMYAYKVADTYYPAFFGSSVFSGAATVDELSGATYSRGYNASAYTTNVDSYADTVAYDDDNDGLYERAYFTYYIFGRYSETDADADGNKQYHFTLGAYGKDAVVYNADDDATTGLTVNNVSGKTLTSGAYVLWAKDALTQVITVKKIYDAPVTAYVTGVNTAANTITVSALGYNLTGLYSGTTLTYGVEQLPGADETYAIDSNSDGIYDNYPVINDDDATNILSRESLIGVDWDLQFQVVKYIVDSDRGGNIVAIISEEAANTPVVIDNYQGFTTLGYLREQVVLNNGTLQIINISKINDYPLFTNSGLGFYAGGLNPNTFGNGDLRDYFYHGELLAGNMVDQIDGAENNGNWLVRDELYNGEYYNYYVPLRETNNNNTVTFWNAIAYEGIGSNVTVVENPFISAYSNGSLNNASANPFSFTATADFVLITPAPNGGFSVAKGIPGNGAMLTIPGGSKIYVSGQYIYILPPMDDDFDFTSYVTFNSFVGSVWNTNTSAGEDIVYFGGTRNYAPSEVINTGSLYNQYGTTLKYTTGYWSLLTGKANADVAAAIYSDNTQLQPGFYTIKNMNYNGTTVKAFDKFLDSSISAADIGDYEVSPTYLTSWGGTWAQELAINAGEPSLNLTRSAVTVQGWSGGAAGRNSNAYSQPAAGTVYLALEYSLNETATGYIPSASKFYFVISTVNLSSLNDQIDYDVVLSSGAAGGSVDYDLALVNGVLGYNVTIDLNDGYTTNNSYFTNSDTAFIGFDAFDASNDYTINVVNTVLNLNDIDYVVTAHGNIWVGFTYTLDSITVDYDLTENGAPTALNAADIDVEFAGLPDGVLADVGSVVVTNNTTITITDITFYTEADFGITTDYPLHYSDFSFYVQVSASSGSVSDSIAATINN